MTATALAPSQRALVRPALRGAIHRSAVPVAVCLAVLLIVRASTGGARVGVLVYVICVIAMLTVSGVYHLPSLWTRDRSILKRVDHSTSLVATAGTYTGVIALGMDGATRVVMLALVWTTVIAGIIVRQLFFYGPPGVTATVYMGSGWMALAHPMAFLDALNGVETGFLVAGGLLYTVGAAIFAARRPNPWPTTFGYHEIFHAFVVAAAFCHWATIYSLAG